VTVKAGAPTAEIDGSVPQDGQAPNGSKVGDASDKMESDNKKKVKKAMSDGFIRGWLVDGDAA